ncbi:hypothetical protein PFICI_04313 [Pestalotiopsis fici W106-1]|uniref:AttH domain-containing protein n=1 Tax=Pestalotiopsis fici (strain W106-1 / CGMCC3.15140) TaxID=1229662 RepID=W3XAJ5_PESFW|nr:uncharacterized protein PFICI_04313 [Pestalotiopsis fici W106-1]ETS82437.1 hypothetical protein PFICI_04313 [Pestalotiopsis fici W106-1]
MRHNSFLAAASLLVPALGKSVFWSPVYNNVTSDVELLSDPTNLDGFKMNASAMVGGAFDFWYFDVASESTNAGVNIVFFNTGDFKYQLGNEQPLAVQLSGKFANGTEFFVQTFATEGAFIKNDECGVFADFKGAGASFVGTNLLKDNVSYTITFDGSAGGLKGTITFKARAPAHFPCDTKDVAGATQNLLPYLFWANAVPDAESVVNLTIDGEPFQIADGIGYHDKNWGQKSVITSPKYWDWGHARVGPYAIVWYDLLDYNDTEHNYAYVSKDGEEPFVGCGGDTVHARQWGPANTTYTYPPTNKLGLLANNGLLIDYELPSGDKLHFNITTTAIIKTETGNVYSRGVGDVEGGVVGGINYSGRAFYEEFIYGLLV